MSNEWKKPIAAGGSAGALDKRMRDQQKLYNDLRASAPLRNATISEGGLQIIDGGDLEIIGDNGAAVRFENGRMFLAYNPDDVKGSIAAGLAVDGVSPAIWIVPPSTQPPVTESENAIILEGRSSDSAGGMWLYTVGRATLQSLGEHVDIKAELNAYVTAGGVLNLVAGGGANLHGGDGGALSIKAGVGQQLQLDAGADMFLKASGTTTSPANTYISGSGSNVVLRQVSSSIRYKVDVEDHHTDQDALLAVAPRSWRDRAEAEENPETTARYVGFIAEELDALGLSEYVVYNPDGSAESVAYDRLTVGLLDVVKTQQKQLEWLTAQVEHLTGQSAPNHRPVPTPGVKATRPVPPAPNVEETS